MLGQAGRRSTNDLLQRVSSQLKGERVPMRDPSSQDDLTAYLSGLEKTRKPSKEAQWEKFGEVSDLSASEPEDATKVNKQTTEPSPGASRFLKKKKPDDNDQGLAAKQPVSPKGSKKKNRKESETELNTGYAKTVQPSYVSQSSALHKVAKFTGKYGGSSAGQPTATAALSDSDMDLSLSMDEDVMADVRQWKQKPAAAQSYPVSDSPILDEDSSSMQIGRGGSRFMKKKRSPTPPQTPRSTSSHTGDTIRRSFHRQASHDTMTDGDSKQRPVIDSEKARKSPQFRPPTPRSPSVEALSDPETEHEDPSYADSVSSGGSFRVNVLDLDNLEPVMSLPGLQESSRNQIRKTKTNPEPEKNDFFSALGLQTLDDLEDPDELSPIQSRRPSVPTIPEVEESDPESMSPRSPTPLKSILATPRLSPTPRSSRGRVRYNIQEIAEARSRSPSPEVISTAPVSKVTSAIYTEDFTEESAPPDVVYTARSATTIDSDPESYSDDFTQSGRSSPDRSNLSRRRSGEVYSDDWTSATEHSRYGRSYRRSSSRESMVSSYTSDHSSYTTESLSPRDRPRTPSPDSKLARRTRSREVQTGLDLGLIYQWDPAQAGVASLGPQHGLAFVDPTPIAGTVVSADALEALTAYSPSVIALNDMLRQQLQLTTQFLSMQRRLHQAYSNLVPDPSYSYTTVENTKKFIKRHQKPTLTFEEALKQVKQEMNLD